MRYQMVCRREIELFAGDALLRRAERSEPWLKESLGEILVVQQDQGCTEFR